MAKEAKFPGFDARLREAMRRAGYWYDDRQEPNVLRFCVERGHVSQYMYAYLSDRRVPDLERLRKLAQDLGVSMAWLLLGEEGVREVFRLSGGEERRGGPHADPTRRGSVKVAPARSSRAHG